MNGFADFSKFPWKVEIELLKKMFEFSGHRRDGRRPRGRWWLSPPSECQDSSYWSWQRPRKLCLTFSRKTDEKWNTFDKVMDSKTWINILPHVFIEISHCHDIRNFILQYWGLFISRTCIFVYLASDYIYFVIVHNSKFWNISKSLRKT